MYPFVSLVNVMIGESRRRNNVLFAKVMTLYSSSLHVQAEQDISSREKNAEQLQDELAAQDESITKLSKEKKALEEAKQVRHSAILSVLFYR